MRKKLVLLFSAIATITVAGFVIYNKTKTHTNNTDQKSEPDTQPSVYSIYKGDNPLCKDSLNLEVTKIGVPSVRKKKSETYWKYRRLLG